LRHEREAEPTPWPNSVPLPACQELDERYAGFVLDHVKAIEIMKKKQTLIFFFCFYLHLGLLISLGHVCG
jgi:hypothetical protein